MLEKVAKSALGYEREIRFIPESLENTDFIVELFMNATVIMKLTILNVNS